jgi:hypothetical protein
MTQFDDGGPSGQLNGLRLALVSGVQPIDVPTGGGRCTECEWSALRRPLVAR